MSYSEVVSSLALLASIIAIGWNIARDLIKDRAGVQLFIAFGEIGNFKNSQQGIFADAGSLLPTHKFDAPGMLVQITNTGRKPIGISTVGGKYKDGRQIFIATQGLPKMLEPYEVFSSSGPARLGLLKEILSGEVEDLWVADTAGKTWSLSERGWERAKRTADYIVSGKHL